MIITIDGPSASGKSTIARVLAQRNNLFYIYSGSLFRALAYLLTEREQYTQDMISHPKKEDVHFYLHPDRFLYTYSSEMNEHIFFEGFDITEHLKSPLIDRFSSIIGTDKYVRECIAQLQHEIAKGKNVVVEGRDSGTAVFPHADFKFYITASAHERAKRIQKMYRQQGKNVSHEEIYQAIVERDKRDEEREHDPLKKATNAYVIDTSDMTIENVVKAIEVYILKHA